MFPDLGDEFSNWWMIHKFELMQDEAVGVREIARAAWEAGRASAQQSVERMGESLPRVQVVA